MNSLKDKRKSKQDPPLVEGRGPTGPTPRGREESQEKKERLL